MVARVLWEHLVRVRISAARKGIMNMKKIILREVRALVKQLDPTATVYAQAFQRAERDGYCATVVRNGKLVGMGWIFPRQTLLRRQAVIEDMIVDVAWRRRMVATEIMQDLLAWAKRNRIEVVELITSPKRIAANRFYRKAGFHLHETNHYLLYLQHTGYSQIS